MNQKGSNSFHFELTCLPRQCFIDLTLFVLAYQFLCMSGVISNGIGRHLTLVPFYLAVFSQCFTNAEFSIQHTYGENIALRMMIKNWWFFWAEHFMSIYVFLRVLSSSQYMKMHIFKYCKCKYHRSQDRLRLAQASRNSC